MIQQSSHRESSLVMCLLRELGAENCENGTSTYTVALQLGNSDTKRSNVYIGSDNEQIGQNSQLCSYTSVEAGASTRGCRMEYVMGFLGLGVINAFGCYSNEDLEIETSRIELTTRDIGGLVSDHIP